MAERTRLVKGDRVRLRKVLPYTDTVYFALSWNTNRYREKRDFDLDLSMVCLDEDEICQDDRYFIWYEHKVSPKNALKHSGDNKKGVEDASEGDAEVIKIKLDQIPDWVKSIVPVITIYDHKDDQHFGLVDNAYIRIMDNNEEEKLRFSLSEEAHVADNVGMVFGKLTRMNDEGEWEFVAVEEGSDYDLEDYIELYGMTVYGVVKKYAPHMLKNQ